MNFIIIHGVYANPNSNWFSWIKKELENKGFEVIVPKFPTPINQSLESWLRAISKHEDKITNETVLIGHSLGAAFILKFLEKTNEKINAAFLVAGFFKLVGSPYDENIKSFFDNEFDWGKIRKNCGKFFVIGSDNDEYIPIGITNQMAKNLGAELKIIHNGGHLNEQSGYDKFPDLLEAIMNITLKY